MQTVRSSLGWRVSETIGAEFVSFVIFTLLARQLTTADFGAVALATASYGIIQIATYHGWIEDLVTNASQTEAERRAAATACVYWGLCLSVGTMLLSVPLSWCFSSPDFPLLLSSLAPLLVVKSIATPLVASYRLAMNFRVVALRTIVGVFAGGVVALSLTEFFDIGKWALVSQIWASELFGLLVLLGGRSKCFERISLKSAFGTFKRISNVMLAQVASQSLRRLDIVIAGVFLPPDKVGILFLVNRLIYSAQLVTQNAINDVALVALSKRAASASGESKVRVYGTVITLATALGSVAFIGMGFVGYHAIPKVFGEQWTPSMALLPLYCAASVFSSAASIMGTVMLSIGQSRQFSLATASSSALRLGAIWIGSVFGLLYIGLGTYLSAIATFFVYLALLRGTSRFPGQRVPFVRTLWLAVLSSTTLLALSVPTFGALSEDVMRTLTGGFIAALITIPFAYHAYRDLSKAT